MITLSVDQIKPAPEMGMVLNTDYLTGLGTIAERMLILVDIDRLRKWTLSTVSPPDKKHSHTVPDSGNPN